MTSGALRYSTAIAEKRVAAPVAFAAAEPSTAGTRAAPEAESGGDDRLLAVARGQIAGEEKLEEALEAYWRRHPHAMEEARRAGPPSCFRNS